MVWPFSLDNGSVWHYNWPHIIYKSLCLNILLSSNCALFLQPFRRICIILGIVRHSDPASDLILFKGHCDIYFIVQWFCLVLPIIFLMDRYHTVNNESVWMFKWTNTIYRSPCYIFYGSVTVSCRWRVFNYYGSYLSNGSVWLCKWPYTIHKPLWYTFHGPVIFPYFSNFIRWICTILGIMGQLDTVNDFIIFKGHCELQFMIHWFCLVSRALFHRYTYY